MSGNQASRNQAVLDSLDFGQVDAESEHNLATTFVRTADFDEFVGQRRDLVRGPKGSGKSALFQLFARHEEVAVRLARGRLDHVLVRTATGLRDVRELSTDNLASLEASGLDAERVWIAYVALKAAEAVQHSDLRPRGELARYMRVAGLRRDGRFLPSLGRALRCV